MAHSLDTREYLEEFYKLDFNDRQKPGGNELGLNQFGYFKFDVKYLDIFTSTLHIANTLYNADKIYLFGYYSYIYAALEALIENGLHKQVCMLDIDIDGWDSINISWKLLSQFTSLKLLYIDGNSYRSQLNKSIPDITAHLPKSLEALTIVNIPYYNEPFSHLMSSSNIKVLRLLALKFNQELCNLPPRLETLIIELEEFNQRMDNLSSSLKHLILLCPRFRMPLDNLPHGLEYFAGLYFNCFIYPEDGYGLELVNLPSSIKSILLDKNLYDKQHKLLKSTYTDCQINCYDNFYNFEFIIKHLLNSIR